MSNQSSNSPSPNPFTPYEPTELDRRLEACAPGAYPWDDWQRAAVAAGVADDIAALGRSVLRETHQHGWCEELVNESGLTDPATADYLIARAKAQPAWTASRWRWLLVTDGLRFDPWQHEPWPECAPEWRSMRRRYEEEVAASPIPQTDAELQVEAGLFIEEFYRLDPLALVDLEDFSFRRYDDGRSVLWGDFSVLSGTLPRRIIRAGVVRFEINAADPSRNDSAVFERVEEGGHE